MLVRIQTIQAIDTRLGVRLAVMLASARRLDRLVLAIVRIGQVRRGHHQIVLEPSKPMCPHVPLILLQDNRATRDTGAGVLGAEHKSCPGGTLGIQFTSFKAGLAVATSDAVNGSAEQTRTSRKESVKGVENGQFGVGTKGGVRVDSREAVANLIDNRLNRLDEVRMARGSGNETVP